MLQHDLMLKMSGYGCNKKGKKNVAATMTVATVISDKEDRARVLHQ